MRGLRFAAACALGAFLSGCTDGDKTGDATLPAPDSGPPVKGRLVEPTQNGRVGENTEPAVVDRPRISPEQIGDWPTFLGPEHTGVSRETGLLKRWPTDGPPALWKAELGETYAAPSVVKGAMIIFHRVNKEDGTAEEVIERIDPVTAKRSWRFAYPTEYRDRLGYNNGPRASATIDEGRVYTLGAESRLQCLDLETGKPIWARNLHMEYFKEPRQNFFGAGVAPRIEGNALLLNLGDENAGCITAIDKNTGKTLWRSGEDGAGYCTAYCADVGTSRFAFFLTREGGLWCDVTDGRIRGQYRFRARDPFSANASSPIVIGDKLFLSAAYGVGSALLQITEKEFKEVWRNKALGAHWATAIHENGYLYGFDGRHEHEAELRCVRLSDGEVIWSVKGYERGSFIRADGKYIILGEDGLLALAELSPKGCKVISTVQALGYHCWTAPVLSRGLLYLLQYNHRTDKATLLCLDLREK
jgi:outer membrane protein assembly factor BamB